tara:strand:- start:1058 stop:1321 length:264 start_codon:yes stop_codon:yes gene_type:complete
MKTTKNNMTIYTNQYGAKTSTEIEAILDQVNNYLNNGSSSSYMTKVNSRKMFLLNMKFDNLFTDVDENGFRITAQDVLGWNFGDALA